VEPCNALSKLCEELGKCCASIGRSLDELFRPCCLELGAMFAVCCSLVAPFFDLDRPFGCCRLITVTSILVGAVLAVFSFISPDNTCKMSPPYWLPVQLVFMALNLLYTFYFFKKVNYPDDDQEEMPFDQRLHQTVMVDPASACMICVEVAAFVWSIIGLDLLNYDCASARLSGYIALISMLMIMLVVLYVISCICGVWIAKDKCLSVFCCPCAMAGRRMMEEADRAETRDRNAKIEREIEQMEQQRIQREKNGEASTDPSNPAVHPNCQSIQSTTKEVPPAVRWIPPSMPYDPRSPKYNRNSEQYKEPAHVQSRTNQQYRKAEGKEPAVQQHENQEEKKAQESPTLSGMMFKMAKVTLFGKEKVKTARKDHIARV